MQAFSIEWVFGHNGIKIMHFFGIDFSWKKEYHSRKNISHQTLKKNRKKVLRFLDQTFCIVLMNFISNKWILNLHFCFYGQTFRNISKP